MNAFSVRLFAKICVQNGEDFIRLLINTEVRWLFKNACLNRFYDHFDSVLGFLESKDNDSRIIISRKDISIMTDYFAKLTKLI